MHTKGLILSSLLDTFSSLHLCSLHLHHQYDPGIYTKRKHGQSKSIDKSQEENYIKKLK